jgi:hypothetical protein
MVQTEHNRAELDAVAVIAWDKREHASPFADLDSLFTVAADRYGLELPSLLITAKDLDLLRSAQDTINLAKAHGLLWMDDNSPVTVPDAILLLRKIYGLSVVIDSNRESGVVLLGSPPFSREWKPDATLRIA